MRITAEHVAKFQRIYFEKFGEEISELDATERLHGLTWLYRQILDYKDRTEHPERYGAVKAHEETLKSLEDEGF